MNATKSRESIIENIENIFMYLACANIDTSLMDGAIPISAVCTLAARENDEAIAGIERNPLYSGLSTWREKIVWIDPDNYCRMSSAESVHWSRIQREVDEVKKHMRWLGGRVNRFAVADYDCFSTQHYSTIDPYGKFVKYRLAKAKRYGQVKVRALFNPRIIWAYKNSRWIPFESDIDNDIYKRERLDEVNQFLVGFAATVRSHWTATVGIERGVPRLKLLTDPVGIKFLWRLRDIPEGKKRRAALLNWVSEHWRKDRHDPDTELFVRKHFRGANTLTQGAFSVEIEPSTDAKVEESLARKCREQMRKEAPRRDRRRRALRTSVGLEGLMT